MSDDKHVLRLEIKDKLRDADEIMLKLWVLGLMSTVEDHDVVHMSDLLKSLDGSLKIMIDAKKAEAEELEKEYQEWKKNEDTPKKKTAPSNSGLSWKTASERKKVLLAPNGLPMPGSES